MANPRYFAVLIGINFYAKKPLEGSVRDIDLIQQYLTAKLEGRINLSQIFRHTASNPTEASGTQAPEEPSSLPTLQNVKKSLAQVTTVAENGDFVYIHFSGHGTAPRGSFGLALLNDEFGETSCLSGSEIAKIIRIMVEKKLKVLLVLDCCFSGLVDRHGDAGNCRFIEYDPTINLQNHKLHDSLIETTYTSVSPSTFRDASTCMNWVVDPKGYTVLTACGPTEQSFELRIGNNERYGILSYFFVRTLHKLGELKMSHFVIFQFICAMFKARLAKQTPQFKGNRDLRFFGHLESSVDMIFPVINLNGRLKIQGGEIFGVQEREELVLSPLNVLRNEDHAKTSVTAIAQHTGGVETDLELADSTFDSTQIDVTWVARPLRWLHDAENPYPSYVTSNYNDNSLEYQVNTENQQASNGLIPPGLTLATAPFKAIVNSKGQFEIRDRADEKVEFGSISLLSPQSKDSKRQVYRLLSHLTRFDGITNVKPRHEDVALRNAIDITLYRSPQGRSSLRPGLEFIEARDGESIKISVANKSKIRAYVHMFCLSVGTWEISNLLAAENTELSADPVELKIQMEVPDCQTIRGIRQSEDIIKVFVTTRSAPFANMVMSMPVFRLSEDGALDSWLVHTFRIRTSKC